MDLIDKAKMFILIIKFGHWTLLVKEILRRIYSNEDLYGLRRDLTIPLEVPEAKTPLTLRRLQKKDITRLLRLNEQNISSQEFKDRITRLFLIRSNISTPYVAVDKNGVPCHIYWLIEPNENERVRTYFKGGFPKLAPDEVLFEAFLTPKEYRGQRIMPKAIQLISEKIKDDHKRWAMAFVRSSNLSSLNAMKNAGFKPFVLRKASWRLFRRTISFISFPPGTCYPMETAKYIRPGKRTMVINRIYYGVKPLLPRNLQIFVRRKAVFRKRKEYRHIWPIDPGASKLPDGWSTWPDKKRFALVLTHDVDTEIGQEKCKKVAEIEERMGFRSSFNFVPERYNVSPELRRYLTEKGFEIGVHGLKHDGRLFSSKRLFQKRAAKINHYLKEWDVVAFASPSMQHRLDWMHELNIEYDSSTFDTDPFEPQSDGVGTIFPFWVRGDASQNGKGYVEIPYTVPQDFTLFILMRAQNIDIWKRKLDWIAEKGGMVLLNTHPDYMNFGAKKPSIEEYPSEYYLELLDYIKRKYKGQYWHVLPKDMARYWVSNMVGD